MSSRKQIFEANRQRRQAVLDYLHAHGPSRLKDLATGLGMPAATLSMVLMTQYRRHEIDRADNGRRIAVWRAIAKTTFALEYDITAHTEKARAAYAQKHADAEAAKRVPGLRVVRLLGKQNTSRGGQCANIGYSSIQCRMDETRVVI